MNHNRFRFAFLFLLLLESCAVGRRHTPDAELEKYFLLHQPEFQSLLSDVRADKSFQMAGIKDSQIRYSNQADISQDSLLARWTKYKKQLDDLGLKMVYREEGRIAFECDEESVINGDSQKGYEFILTSPERQKASLDSYRISESDKINGGYLVYKAIAGYSNWHLYLFVND